MHFIHINNVLILLFFLKVWAGEYQQLLVHIDSSKFIHNNSNYLTHTSGCVESFYLNKITQGNPPRFCRHKSLIHLNHLKNESEDESILQCKYSIKMQRNDENKIISNNVVFRLTIAQSDCSKSTAFMGGSSFTVSIHTDSDHILIAHSYVWCNITHTSDGQYEARCSFPIDTVFNTSSTSSCVSVSVTLDYEHFNAFHEVHALLRRPLNHSLHSQLVCFDAEKVKEWRKRSSQVDSVPHQVLSSERIASCLSSTDTTNTTIINMSAMSSRLILVGSSHMRYIWDALVVDHIPGGRAYVASLPVHHGDSRYGAVQFVSSLFALQLPRLLRDACDDMHDAIARYRSEHKPDPGQSTSQYAHRMSQAALRLTVVLQSLAWDLDYFPPRNVLQHAQSSTQIFEAIKHMARSECGRFIDLVWLTAVPVPSCLQPTTNHHTSNTTHPTRPVKHKITKVDPACSGGGRGYRNNHAIQALNEHFVRELGAIQYPAGGVKRSPPEKSTDHTDTANATTSLRIIDAFQLIYPHHADRVCGLHFTCTQRTGGGGKHASKNTKDVNVLQTRGGRAVIGAILSNVCSV